MDPAGETGTEESGQNRDPASNFLLPKLHHPSLFICLASNPSTPLSHHRATALGTSAYPLWEPEMHKRQGAVANLSIHMSLHFYRMS